MSKVIKSADAFRRIRAKRFDISEFEAKGKAIIVDARARAKSIYDQAEKVLADARDLSVKSREERKQAAHILANAEQKLREAEEQARNKGYEDGNAQGLEEGLAEGARKGREEAHREAYEKAFAEKQKIVEEESKHLTERLKSIFEILDTDIERIRASARGEVIQLAVAIAAKVVKREVNLDPRIILPNVKKAIDLSLQKKEVTCRVNPEDKGLIEHYIPELKSAFARVEHLEVVADESVPPGGCIVESGSGTVDMQLETQLAEIERQLSKRKGV